MAIFGGVSLSVLGLLLLGSLVVPGADSQHATWATDDSINATTYIPPSKDRADEETQPAVNGWAPTSVVEGKGKKPLRTEAETRDVMMSIASEMGMQVDPEHVSDMAPLMKDLSTMIYHHSSTADVARHRTLLDRSMGQRTHQKLIKKLAKYFPDDTADELEERLFSMQSMIQEFAQKTPHANYMDVVTETAKRLGLSMDEVDMGELNTHMKWMEKVVKTLNPGLLGTLGEQKAEEL